MSTAGDRREITLRQRLTPFAPIVVMAAMAGATYWLLKLSTHTEAVTTAPALQHTPDYFGNDMSVSMLDQTGTTQYRLNAKTMVHYEDDQTTDLTLPALRSFSPGEPVVTSTAQRGKVNSDASVIDMYDDAKIMRAPGPQDPPMEADSSHFTVYVNEDKIVTQEPVKLTRGPSVSTATQGMTYVNTTRAAELFGNVRGSIAAAQLNGGGNH